MKKTKKDKPKLLVIYGPTVTGKTALAIKLAKKFNGEIISADSRQVYKGLDIGTGKVNFSSKVEKHQGYWIVDDIKVHGFDVLNPGKQYSVSEFIDYGSKSVTSITKLGKLPILVGGTGFYIKSFLYGLESQGIRKNTRLRNSLSKLSALQLFEKLRKLNPQKAASLNRSDVNNPRRLIRTIEIEKSTSKQANLNTQRFVGKIKIIGLTAPNEYLYRKADKWLEDRLKAGLADEIKKLMETVDSHWLSSLGLEYKWLALSSLGKKETVEAIKRLKGDIHAYIRRQKTWFKQFKNIMIYDISKKEETELVVRNIENFVKN